MFGGIVIVTVSYYGVIPFALFHGVIPALNHSRFGAIFFPLIVPIRFRQPRGPGGSAAFKQVWFFAHFLFPNLSDFFNASLTSFGSKSLQPP